MKTMGTVIHKTTGIVLVFILGVVANTKPAAADDLGRARQLVQRAEVLFQLKRSEDALSLLRQALKSQIRDGKQYGYARYIHFLRGRYYFKKGDRKKALAELKRALKIKEGQDLVGTDHQISARHPFIIGNFPKLAGITVTKVPSHNVLANSKRIINLGGAYLYGLADRALFRLDRKAMTLLAIHQAEKKISQASIHANHRHLLLSYAGQKSLHAIDLDPLAEHHVPLPAEPLRFVIHNGGNEATVYLRQGRYGLRAFIMPTDGRRVRRNKPVIKVDGKLLFGGRRRALVATYSFEKGRRFDPDSAPVYAEIQLHEVGRRPRSIYKFDRIDPRNRIFAVTSRRKDKVAIFVLDVAKNRREVLVYEMESKKVHRHRSSIAISQPPTPSVAFSYNGDFLILTAQRHGRLRVVRMGIEKGNVAEIALLPASKAAVFGLGLLKDDKTVWIHQGDQLTLVRLNGKAKRTPLVRWTRVKRPAWRAQSTYMVEPDQLFFGFKAGKKDRVMMLPLSKANRP